MKQQPTYIAYCDGASRKDGRGGWGYTFHDGSGWVDGWGGAYNTTNNRMELRAVIECLRATPADIPITIYCDSQYVLKGADEYLEGWKARRWRTGANKLVKNVDLWQTLDDLIQGRMIEWVWVRGHTGVEGNEHADMLATRGVPEPR